MCLIKRNILTIMSIFLCITTAFSQSLPRLGFKFDREINSPIAKIVSEGWLDHTKAIERKVLILVYENKYLSEKLKQEEVESLGFTCSKEMKPICIFDINIHFSIPDAPNVNRRENDGYISVRINIDEIARINVIKKGF